MSSIFDGFPYLAYLAGVPSGTYRYKIPVSRKLDKWSSDMVASLAEEIKGLRKRLESNYNDTEVYYEQFFGALDALEEIHVEEQKEYERGMIWKELDDMNGKLDIPEVKRVLEMSVMPNPGIGEHYSHTTKFSEDTTVPSQKDASLIKYRLMSAIIPTTVEPPAFERLDGQSSEYLVLPFNEKAEIELGSLGIKICNDEVPKSIETIVDRIEEMKGEIERIVND